MTGHERALFYRLAIETGLRASEIESITDFSSFNTEAIRKTGPDDITPNRPPNNPQQKPQQSMRETIQMLQAVAMILLSPRRMAKTINHFKIKRYANPFKIMRLLAKARPAGFGPATYGLEILNVGL
jgi:hypothetical protein